MKFLTLINLSLIICLLTDYECQFCNICFAKKEDLTRHNIAQMHEKLYIYPCQECTEKFEKKRLLKAHINTCHIKYDHICGICKRTFAKNNILETHVNGVHLRLKPYHCDNLWIIDSW